MIQSHKKIIVFSVLILISIFAFHNTVLATEAENSWLEYGETVSCGSINNIPVKVPNAVASLIKVLNVVVPVILVIFGVIDLVKGMMSGDEKDIKKGQQSFIKRLIAGAVIFLIVIAVKFLVNLVAENEDNKASIISCMNCFISGECSSATGSTSGS